MKDEYSQDFDFVKYTDISDMIQDEQTRKNAFARRHDDPEIMNGIADDNLPDAPEELFDDIPDDALDSEETYDEPIISMKYYPTDPPDEYEEAFVSEQEDDPETVETTRMQNEEFEREYEFDRERALEQIKRAKEKRELADQLAKDKLHAEILMVLAAVVLLATVIFLIVRVGKKKPDAETFKNISTADVTDSQEDLEDLKEPIEKPLGTSEPEAAGGHTITEIGGITFVDDIMIVNKTYGLPSTYDPSGLDPEAEAAFYNMSAQAWSDGITLWICSGFRSYDEQLQLFEQYASTRGLEEADAVSARPGHSEHQTGLCIDVNSTDFSFADSAEARWLEEHCAEFGFILRFPKGKELLTGYEYEPWHIRYVGVTAAMAMKASGKCLEEYLGVTSNYADSPDNNAFLQKYAHYAGIHPDSSQDSSSDAGIYDDPYADNYDNTWDNGYDNTWDNNTWDYGYDNTWDYGYDEYTY